MQERDQVISDIVECQRGLFRAMHREMPPRAFVDTTLTMPQLKTLMCLYGSGHSTMGELADALGVSVSTLTGIVDRLVDHGLVMRENDPHDRRVVVGRLTSAGGALVDQLFLSARDRLGRALAQLSDEDLRLVGRAFRLMLGAVERSSSAATILDESCLSQRV